MNTCASCRHHEDWFRQSCGAGPANNFDYIGCAENHRPLVMERRYLYRSLSAGRIETWLETSPACMFHEPLEVP